MRDTNQEDTMQGTPNHNNSLDHDTLMVGSAASGTKLHAGDSGNASLCGYGWNTGYRLLPSYRSTLQDVDCRKCRHILDTKEDSK